MSILLATIMIILGITQWIMAGSYNQKKVSDRIMDMLINDPENTQRTVQTILVICGFLYLACGLALL